MSETSQAVPPILASALLMTAEAEERSLRAPLSCGLATIDNLVLDGGFRHGEITSVAGATATGKTLVCPLFFGNWLIFKKAALRGSCRVVFKERHCCVLSIFISLTDHRISN